VNSKEIRFYVPLPLDVEPLLAGLLGPKVLAKEFRARTYAAGDFLAGLVREAHAAAEINRKIKDYRFEKPLRGKAPVAADKKSMRRRPPEPEED